MLDLLANDGRARILRWQPQPDQSLESPTLIFPQTSMAQPPAWIQAVVTQNHDAASTTERASSAAAPTSSSVTSADASNRVVMQSGGTWFYPLHGPAGSLVVSAIPTAPTTQVQIVAVGTELAAFHDAVGWASNPKNLVPAFIQARKTATSGRLLWAPGLGTPQDYALWCYLGVDLFDASPLLLAAARGQALTVDGPITPVQAARLLADPTAVKSKESGKFSAESGESGLDFDALVAFNLEMARRELLTVSDAIRAGTLRALAERRSYAKAASVETLRRFDREHHYLEASAPKHRTTPLPAMTSDSIWMPEVEAFRRTYRDRYEPPRNARILLLLPCSQKKPYKISRSHRLLGKVLDESGIRPLLHEVMITSPLGLVPRELEEVYPANQYDIPVTGHWMRDEEAIVREQLAALLDKHGYEHVVVHSGQATFDILRDLLPESVRHTCLHHPTSREDLARLGAELARLKAAIGPVDLFGIARDRKLEDLRALATFQFGPAIADALTTGSKAHGRMPFVKLDKNDVQLGMTTPDRGVLSLTLDGAAILAKHQAKRVFIQDFHPKKTSSLFAVGVEGADADVRAGDEVVVVRRLGPTTVTTPDADSHVDLMVDVRACGVAGMSAEEMTHLQRGVAVTLRHVAPASPAPRRAAESAEPKETVSLVSADSAAGGARTSAASGGRA